MPNHVSHFAIHADDCDRAMRFYGDVFGWTFEPWGPPGFWLISTGEGGIRGALHARQEPLTGTGMAGYECSISVKDVEATKNAIKKAGGTVLFEPFHIDGVGTLIKFHDTEGNIAGAMQYVEGIE